MKGVKGMNREEQLVFLKEFTEAKGISGDEKEVSRVMKKYLEGYADEFDYDNLGSLIALKKGTSDIKVMLSGHIDEVGFIVSYIEEDGHVEFPNNQGMFYKVNDHNVKSLTTFVGAYGTKMFEIKQHKTLAYAKAGWLCECLRNGNKYSYERHINQRNDGRQANLPYLPRNTGKVSVGIKSLLNEWIECEVSVGANIGSKYYNINGNVGLSYQF